MNVLGYKCDHVPALPDIKVWYRTGN